MDPRLEPLKAMPEGYERRLAFMALISEEFRRRGASPPIVVGGHAVEIYTLGAWPTRDIDVIVADVPLLAEICASLGLGRVGRHFYHKELAITLEAPGSELPERVSEVLVGDVPVRVSALEEILIDRLNAMVHWKSERDAEAALALLLLQGDALDETFLQRRAKEEDVAKALEEVRDRARAAKPLP